MKRGLLFIAFLVFSTALQAQFKFVSRYCLLPYVEVGVGRSGTFATPGYYNAGLNEGALAGSHLSLGLGKQLDDLKFTASLGVRNFAFRKAINKKNLYVDKQRQSYFSNNLSFESEQFDTALFYSTRMLTRLHYGTLSLGVEKSLGYDFSAGIMVHNAFLFSYLDKETMVYGERDTINGYAYINRTSYESQFLPRSARGIRTYQALVELRGTWKVRRPKVKADYGISAMMSINSVTKTNPSTTYLQHIGLYSRFYFLPKQF